MVIYGGEGGGEYEYSFLQYESYDLTADILSRVCGNNTVFRLFSKFPLYTTHLILYCFDDPREKTLKYIQSQSNGMLGFQGLNCSAACSRTLPIQVTSAYWLAYHINIKVKTWMVKQNLQGVYNEAPWFYLILSK
jgi:hypothetical protein